jgi:hypothetical protein
MTATHYRELHPNGGHPPWPRPFPLAPLLALIPGAGLERAARLNITPRYYWRLHRYGALTVDQADRYAYTIDRHPCEIWGELWWQHADPEDNT